MGAPPPAAGEFLLRNIEDKQVFVSKQFIAFPVKNPLRRRHFRPAPAFPVPFAIGNPFVCSDGSVRIGVFL
jgi:hypothetical protein